MIRSTTCSALFFVAHRSLQSNFGFTLCLTLAAMLTLGTTGARAQSQVAATPQFSVSPGYYPGTQSVTITDTTPGATIYYTTNGTFPTTTSPIYFGSAITVSTSEVLVATATAPGYRNSQYGSAGYFIGTTPTSFIYTLAGNGSWGYTGDGGQATEAQLNNPTGSVMDSAGNLYVVDSGNNAVRKIAASTGIITTIAGLGGYPAHTGDNGPAAAANLWWPESIAIDAKGNLYIGENGDGVVRRIDASTGVITTSAWDLGIINALAVDGAGNLYIAENFSTIRMVNAQTGIITTVAGDGTYGFSGDNGPATSAEITYPWGLAFDSGGNLYFSDEYNHVVRKVAAGTGIITTVVGVPTTGGCSLSSGEGGPASAASLCYPRNIAIDGQNNLYIADSYNNVIREVSAQTGTIRSIAGIWQTSDSLAGDGYPATNVALSSPQYIWADSTGNVYLSDQAVSLVQKITVPVAPPTVTTAAPTLSLASGTYDRPQTLNISDTTSGAATYITFFGLTPSTMSRNFHGPLDVTGSTSFNAVAVEPGYLPSAPVTANYTITSTPEATISTIAGGPMGTFSPTGGPATSVTILDPLGLAMDKAGNLYIVDNGYDAVWRMAAGTGNLTLIAGTGLSGYSGDGGAGTSAKLNRPAGVAVDGAGNVYIADRQNNRVRMVSAQTGVITTVAGSGASSGLLGDGGAATQALLIGPAAVAFDSAGNLYIADSGNGRIRMVNAQTGIINTVAGGGTDTETDDGPPAIGATLNSPIGVTIDATGNIYIAEDSGRRIRMVTAQTGILSTIAGHGEGGSGGDGEQAFWANVSPTGGVAVDGQGNVYFSNFPATVRKIWSSDSSITRYVGIDYASFGGDGGAASMAGICEPSGLVFDSAGDLYVADLCNSRIRKVVPNVAAATPVFSLAGGVYLGLQTVTITDATANATIYYTRDGSTPTTASTVYSGAISLYPQAPQSMGQPLKAIAVATGYAQSAVMSATYIIDAVIATPTVTVTPSASSVSTGQAFTVSVTVSPYPGTGSPTPTGSVALASGNLALGSAMLVNGNASISIAGGVLPVGNDTLTATYSNYGISEFFYPPYASGSATVSVGSGTHSLTYSMSATGVTLSKGGTGSSTVTVSSANGYAGTVTLTCTVTSRPASATDTPSCSASQGVTLSASATSGTAAVTVNTTAASARMVQPALRNGNRWTGAVGGAALALLFFFIPRRHRFTQMLLGLAVISMLSGGLAACGGGSSGTKTTGSTSSGTTAGSYTITVTGTGSDLAKTTETTTFTLTVN